MELLGHLWQQYGAQHPFLSHLIVAFAAPWIVSKLEEQIPTAVNWAEEYQDRALRKAGLSEEAIIALDERELKDMRAAADAFEKEINERKAALAAHTPQ